MTRIVAIDPGSEESGLVVWDGENVTFHTIADNNDILDLLCWLGEWAVTGGLNYYALVIEYTEPFPRLIPSDDKRKCRACGKPIKPGRYWFPSQYQTSVLWTGKFAREWNIATDQEPIYFSRKQVLKHLRANKKKTKYHNPGSQDSQVMNALINRLGPKGTKKNPGVTYGVKSHEWQALGVAVSFLDLIPKADF